EASGTNSESTDQRRAIDRHLHPEPRCALGRFLADHALASAMIDISDGLSTDLNHLCAASGTGARIWSNLIPRPESQPVAKSGRRHASSGSHRTIGNPGTSIPADRSLELALNGGEDYELLFTVPKRKVAQVPAIFRGVQLHRIGEMIRSKLVWLVYGDDRE